MSEATNVERQIEELLDEWFHEDSSLHGDFKTRLLGIIAADRRARQEETNVERLDLRAFARSIIDAAHDWDGHPGDLDGGTLQEIAEEHGVLVLHRVTEPCSEDACVCAEYGDWPVDCYRLNPALEADRRAEQQDREHDMDLAYAKGWNDARAGQEAGWREAWAIIGPDGDFWQGPLNTEPRPVQESSDYRVVRIRIPDSTEET